MIKALLLIAAPAETWERIYRAQHGFIRILCCFLLPLLVLVSAVEGYGLHHWGKTRGNFQGPRPLELGEVVVFEAGQVLLWVLIVLAAAWVIKALGETFHGRHTFLQTFTVTAYSLSPLFALRMLDAFPVISPWISWSLGILLSLGVLYQGIPRVMLPDPPHAFGLYVMSSVLLLALTGLTRFVTALYLAGRFTPLETAIRDLGRALVQ